MKFNSQNGYKASIYKNGVQMNSKKDFFPDEWNEEKVIDAIKEAWDNKVLKPLWGSGKYLGHSGPPENIPIEIKVVGNKIKTAWPRW